MFTVPDYQFFDPNKGHYYVLATAGGDGWECYPPIAEAIQRDMEAAIYNCTRDEEESEILGATALEWINEASVYVDDEEGESVEVARLDIKTMTWIESA